MTRTQISLDAPLYRDARSEAKRRGISFAELCRRALRHEVPAAVASEAPWLRWAGVVASGDRKSVV